MLGKTPMIKHKLLRTIFLSTIAIVLFAGSGCSFSSGSTSGSLIDGRAIPEYQGMTVSSTSSVKQSIAYANDINQDNPFDDDEENQIESRLDTFLGADLIDEEYAYFAQPSELVRVTISMLNPDSFAFSSLSLNGRRYLANEFKEGSSLTSLLIDVQPESDTGVQEITLEDIKYIDGASGYTLKEAVLSGETTVQVGVLFPTLPEVTVSEKIIGITSVGLSINVIDINGLIEDAPKPLYVFLYDGNEVVEQELAIGANEINFPRLKSKTIYQYAVATVFDILDGAGNVVRIFAKEALRTNSFLTMALGATKTEITFDITVDDINSLGEIESVDLYHGETLKETITSQSAGTFSGLFTNNAYLIKAYFSYQFEAEGEVFEEVEEQVVTTESNIIPTFAFVDVVPGQEDIVFEYLVTDVDSVGSLTKIELINNGAAVETMTTYDSTMFDEILSNNDYQLKATYVYNLNEGMGEQILEVIFETKTLAKEEPVFVPSGVSPLGTSINLDAAIVDADNVGYYQSVELHKDDALVDSILDFNSLTFIDLTKVTDYVVKITYIYDLNDGTGQHTLSIQHSISTLLFDMGDGSVSNPDQIANAEDLSNISLALNANYALTTNINLLGIEWTPIGTNTSPFTGTFDGQDCIISNLTITTPQVYVGLFGYNSGTIKNIIFDDVNINVTGLLDSPIYGGSLAGYNSGLVENIHTLSGGIYIKARGGNYGYAGGIIGCHSITNLVDISNGLNVTGDLVTYTGGIVGYSSGSQFTHEYLINIGSVSGANYVGGLIGSSQSSSSSSISNSYNSGSVSGNSYVGGLLGFISSSISSSINNSYNSGEVSGTSNYVGGLIGCSHSSSSFSSISNSYNSEPVSGANDVGGLIGYAYYSSPVIINSHNNGMVSGTSYVGGFIGYLDPSASLYVYYSINFGSLTATTDTTAIGGITGYLPPANDSEQVYFSGTVMANGGEVAGIAYGTKINDLSTLNLAFFTATLGWSSDVWDFTGIDVTIGVYPSLIIPA